MIHLSRVSKVYGDQVQTIALHPLELLIEPGEVVVVLGPSGSGKTTLLNLIGGLDQPTEGEIEVAGVRLQGKSERELGVFRRENIGFVFQFFNLIPTLTVAENVQLVAELGQGQQVERVSSVLEDLGILELADRFPSEISGGQQQRVAIARALVKRPHVLLADEPTGALDEESGKLVLNQLVGAARNRNIPVVIVTHHAAVGTAADRVIRLRDGRIQWDERNESPVPVDDLNW